jgi:hypothetical protein
MIETRKGQGVHAMKRSKFTVDQIAFALKHRKLKQIVADLSLDKAMLQAVVAKKL